MEHLRADVAIVGGGIAGCAAAVALRQANLSVVLLEKAKCGAGASGVNFGGVRQQGRHLAELPLAQRARPMWDRLSAILEEDVEFQATGHIKLARSDADMAELEAYAREAGCVCKCSDRMRCEPNCRGWAIGWWVPLFVARMDRPIHAS
jgi:glycine/D-amino acid oxidase-like deaminating enzyme